MKKRILICIVCAIMSLLALQGCKNNLEKAEGNTCISDEVWCNPSYLPDDIDQTRVRMLNIPGYQQYVYLSTDSSNRLVIDIQKEKNITVDSADATDIDIGSHEGSCYIYNGESMNYGDLSENITSRLTKIALDEIVIEWDQANVFCRVFGTYPIDEMVKIAKNVEVYIYD